MVVTVPQLGVQRSTSKLSSSGGEANATATDAVREPPKNGIQGANSLLSPVKSQGEEGPSNTDGKAIYATMQLPEPTPKLSVLMGIEGSGTRTDPGSLESEMMKVCEEKRSMDPGRMNGQGGDLGVEALRLD